MSDSDDDNFVRYGTALEPIEEDFTVTMQPNTTPCFGSTVKKKYNKLRRVNVDPQRALALCRLPWKDICAQVPGLAHGNLPVMEVEKPPQMKKKKKKKSKVKKQKNCEIAQNQPPVRESEDRMWRDRSQERDIRWNQREMSSNFQTELNEPRSSYNEYLSYYRSHQRSPIPENIQRDNSPHNNWTTAGTSQMRIQYQNTRKRHIDDFETNSNCSQPPRKVARDVHVDTNYNRPPSERDYPLELDYSPVYSNRSTSQTQGYVDMGNTLHVRVQNDSRAAKRPHHDNNERYPYHQLYDSENSSLNARRNYESQPSELDLRHQMKRTRRTSDNYYDHQGSLPNPSRDNYSYRGSANSDCRSLSRQLNTPEPIRIDSDNDFDQRYSRERSYEPHTPVDNTPFDYNQKPVKRVVKAEKIPIKMDSEKNSKSIRVGIQNVTPMTKKEMGVVHQAINKEILKIGQQGAGPKFLGSAYKFGWILMICEDNKTRKWLEKIVAKLKPWPQAKLSLMPQDTFPKSIVLSLLIPSKEGVSIPSALELLRVQNPGLHTEHWKVFKILKVNEGDIVHISVDNASYEALKRTDFKVNLGIDKLTFWPKGKKPSSAFNKKSTRKKSPIKFVKERSKTPASCVSLYEPRTPELPPDENTSGSNQPKPSKNSRKRFNRRLRKLSEAAACPTIQEEAPSQNWYPKLDASYTSSEWVPY